MGHDKESAVGRFNDFVYVVSLVRQCYLLECVLVSVSAESVDCGKPDLSFRIAEDIIDLTVRNASRCIGVEILPVLVAGIFVQPAESSNPDMSVLVLFEIIDLLVGDIV